MDDSENVIYLYVVLNNDIYVVLVQEISLTKEQREMKNIIQKTLRIGC